MANLRIILVDDEPSILMVLQIIIERVFPGTIITTAASAHHALDRLRQQPCDMVFCDVCMPGGSGFFLLEQARREWPSLPIVLMSGTPVAIEARAIGAHAFLIKPFDFEEIRLALSADFHAAADD